jgi:hypothetical protein
VRPRTTIDPTQRHRACETIRVFNLDCGTLRAARRRALRAYESRQPGILEALMEFDEQCRQEFIDMEVQATSGNPYWTVIRHFFEKIG